MNIYDEATALLAIRQMPDEKLAEGLEKVSESLDPDNPKAKGVDVARLILGESARRLRAKQ